MPRPCLLLQNRATPCLTYRFRGYVVQKAYRLYKIGGVVSELLYSPAAYGLDLSVLNAPKPKARICSMVRAVSDTA